MRCCSTAPSPRRGTKPSDTIGPCGPFTPRVVASCGASDGTGAPGIRIGNVHLMAGVPHIAAQMLDALTGTLEGGAPLLSETVGGWLKESEVADILSEVERAHDGCQIGRRGKWKTDNDCGLRIEVGF